MNITNNKVTDYITNYYKPLDEEMMNFRLKAEEKSIPIILRETEMYLGVMMKILNPKRILEIGTAVGYSAVYFTRLLSEASLTTIDRHPVMIPIAHKTFAEYPEGSRIDFRVGEATEILQEMIDDAESQADKYQPYDFVFIDAAKSHYREFFDLASKLCKPGAVIICDNILMKAYLVDDAEYDPGRRHRTSVKRMQEFIDYIYGREDLAVTILSDGDGLAVIKLND